MKRNRQVVMGERSGWNKDRRACWKFDSQFKIRENNVAPCRVVKLSKSSD